jgi:hypothetical protein
MAIGAPDGAQNVPVGSGTGSRGQGSDMSRRDGAWALLAATSMMASTASQAEPPQLYKQASAAVEACVDDLLARMTLEEKVA